MTRIFPAPGGGDPDRHYGKINGGIDINGNNEFFLQLMMTTPLRNVFRSAWFRATMRNNAYGLVKTVSSDN